MYNDCDDYEGEDPTFSGWSEDSEGHEEDKLEDDRFIQDDDNFEYDYTIPINNEIYCSDDLDRQLLEEKLTDILKSLEKFEGTYDDLFEIKDNVDILRAENKRVINVQLDILIKNVSDKLLNCETNIYAREYGNSKVGSDKDDDKHFTRQIPTYKDTNKNENANMEIPTHKNELLDMSDVARLEASLEEMLNNILTELLNLNEGPVDQVYDINVKVTTICKENNHLIEVSPSLKALIKKISDEILLREDTLIAEQPDYTGDPNRDENWIDNVTGRRVQYLNEKLKSILKNLNSDDPSDQIYDIMDQVKLLEENNKNIITDQPNTQSLIKKIYDKITDYESELIAERLGYEDDYDTLNKKLDNYLTVLIKFDDGQGIDPIRQISKKVGILCEKHEHIIKCSQALELCIKKIHFHIATITNRIKGKTGNVQSTPQKIYLVDTELVNILSLLKDIDEPSDIVDDLKERVKTLCTLNKNVIDKSSELQLVVKEIEDKVEYLSTYNYYSLKQKLDNILTILTNFKDSDGHESIIQINEEVEMLCTKYGHLIKHSHELRLCLKRINSHVSIITNQLRYDNNNYDSKSLRRKIKSHFESSCGFYFRIR